MLSVIFSLTQNVFFHDWEYFPVPGSASVSQTGLISHWIQDLSTDRPCLPCRSHIVVSTGKKDEQTRIELKNRRTTTRDMLGSTLADSPATPQAWTWLGVVPGVLVRLVACSNLSAADLVSFLALVILEARNPVVELVFNSYQSFLVRGTRRSLTLWKS